QWRKDDTDVVVVSAPPQYLRRSSRVPAHCLERVRAATPRRGGPRPVFGDRQASTCNYKGCCCRNVKSLCRARSSPRRIDENLVTRSHGNRAVPHCFGHARELINRLAFHRQAGKRGSYLCVSDGRIEKAFKEVCGLRAAEILTMHETRCRLAQFQIGNLAKRRRSVWPQRSFDLF